MNEKVIFKGFSKNDTLNNVLVPISLKADKVIFFSREEYSLKVVEGCKEVLNSRGIEDIEFILICDEKNELDDYFNKYPNALVDMTGSRYILLRLFEQAQKHHNDVYYYDSEDNCIKSYHSHGCYKEKVPSLSIKELITLSGGKIVSNIHRHPDLKNNEINEAIVKMVENNLDTYSEFITFVNVVNKIIVKEEDTLTHPLTKEEFNRLKQQPILQQALKLNLFNLNKDSLNFDNHVKQQLFLVAGTWLESYLYLKLKENNYFNDVMMSVVIDFSEKHDRRFPVICEIDVLASHLNALYFISCKSNKVDTNALNEIKIHNNMFGNDLSKPVICTLEDLRNCNINIYQKAQELGIVVIDLEIVKNQRIYSMFE